MSYKFKANKVIINGEEQMVIPGSLSLSPVDGHYAIDSSDGKLKVYNESKERWVILGDAEDMYFDNSSNSFVAENVQNAIEEVQSSSNINVFGDGSDNNVSLSSGTTNLVRTMYYNNLTLSGTATLNTNGYKIYVKNTLSISDSAIILRSPNNGNNASGQTAGTGGVALTLTDSGVGLAGRNGSNGASGGLGGSGGIAGIAAGTASGYGGAGGASGSSGSGAAGAAGTYTHVPERILRHDHIYNLNYKNGGQGGAGGAGGSAAILANGGGGGGGGSGGGVIIIFAKTINNTSSNGILAKGGNGGNGGNAPNGNATGGGGGGGGGGGHIYIVCEYPTSIGTLNVNGGTGGTGGNGSSGASNGNVGSAGSNGHYGVYNILTNEWTIA